MKNFSRRAFLQTAAAGLLTLRTGRPARAQSYPSRPVRIIVGYPAGGVGDIIARVIGQRLSNRLGQPFIVDDRPGANSNLGTETVIRAMPDGYTLLLATVSNAVNTTLYDNLNFDFVEDITPIGSIMRLYNVMVVPASLPVRSVPEFIAYAKANAGKVNMASGGIGSTQHIFGELFKMMSSVDMVHVPYRGSQQAITDMLSDHVQVMFDPVASSIEHIKSGRLRALAVTAPTRLEALPDVPALAEFLPGYEAVGWLGIAAPKNAPTDAVELLNRELNSALEDPTIMARLAQFGGVAFPQSSTSFAKFVADETNKWAKVVKFAAVKAE
jgi:tripartite-type tricarboxylate transporter receptor subunit TctC